MKLILKTVILLILTVSFTGVVFALQIISPQEGQIVYQGERLTVIVKPDPGENWEEVLLSIYPMSYNILKGVYEEEIEIPIDRTGNLDFRVFAYDKSGTKVKLTRNLFVKMPPNVVLQTIMVNKEYMLLYKLPAGSSPDDMRRIESRQLHVDGMYSDGVERDLTLSASGTTYTSSNEKIVTVSPDGKVTAQGLGGAKVTVRNGKYSTQVDIEVVPYRQPQR